MAGKDKQSKKMRIEFRKKHQGRVRQVDLTRQYNDSEIDTDEMPTTERVSGKGSLTRHRTVIGKKSGGGEADGLEVDLALEAETLSGRVLRVHGLDCVVAADDGKQYFCAVRRLLKSLSTDQRHVVVAGDIVHFRPTNQGQGLILRIDPRHGVVSRTSRGRRHVMVSNVDQLLIVTSAAEPGIKPNLIDRLLLTAEQSRLDPVICINKVDLVDQSTLQVLVGVYSQMGYRVLLVSAAKNWGIDWLREMVAGRQSVVAGQSGVGKSSILNAIQPGLALRVQTVSTDNDKGRHTTTTAELIPLEFGGYLVDTPGIRQFQLWDISNEEVSGLFRDLRPYVSHCRFPDCTHLHEVQCAVKDAVADGKIDPRRYDSYCHLLEEEEFND